MTIIFALFFLLLGFIGGITITCDRTLDMLRDCAKKGVPFIGKYRITVTGEEPQD